MLTSPTLLPKPPSANTLEQLVLRAPRATILASQGDGFGAYVQRLINTAHETHRSFSNLLQTTEDIIAYLRDELDRSYSQYQFTILVGNDFDYDQSASNPSAFVEHTGLKFLILSSIGTSYRYTTTVTNDAEDNKKKFSW